MSYSDDLTAALGEGAKKFYQRHRGGSGNVVLAIIYDEDGDEHFGIFSSIEKAETWRLRFEGDAVFSPYVVDEPE